MEYWQAQAKADDFLAENNYQQSLGRQEALTLAHQELAKKNFKESLIYFERSLSTNPGEWYSLSDFYNAQKGKSQALRKLGKPDEAKETEKDIPNKYRD